MNTYIQSHENEIMSLSAIVYANYKPHKDVQLKIGTNSDLVINVDNKNKKNYSELHLIFSNGYQLWKYGESATILWGNIKRFCIPVVDDESSLHRTSPLVDQDKS